MAGTIRNLDTALIFNVVAIADRAGCNLFARPARPELTHSGEPLFGKRLLDSDDQIRA